MGRVTFNFRSQALGHYVDITIIYPTDAYSYYDESTDGSRQMMPGLAVRPMYRPGMKFQTVYLLHGGGDDHSLTYRYSNAERYAQDNHVMLVTPDIPNSFGVDTCYGVRNLTFLTEELPVIMQTLFASSPERQDTFIMGYAMGGNAALGAAIMIISSILVVEARLPMLLLIGCAVLVLVRHLPALLRITRGEEERVSFKEDLTYKLDSRF